MTDTERVVEATRSFLDDHPDSDETLQALLALDAETDSWTFDDVPVDSGRFGELVSRGIVVKTSDGEYRLADPDAVAAGLRGEPVPSQTEGGSRSPPSISLPSIDGRLVAGILGVVFLVVATRSLYIRQVYQGERIVSPANDPYFYRYWQETLLEQSSGVTDFGMLATIGEQTSARPFTHTVNWWVTEMLGGSLGAAETVAAWQPIVATLVLIGVLYVLIHALTADHRIALASILLLALSPVHVNYTALGFVEHRPFQYLFIGLLAAALALLAVDFERRLANMSPQRAARSHLLSPRSWGLAAALAIAVFASAHVYGGSPLTFIPVAVYVGLRVVVDVRRDVPPLFANGPLLFGLVVGGIVALGAHLRWGWHESIAGVTPVLVAGGALIVVLVGTLWQRIDAPAKFLFAVELVVAIGGLILFRELRPEDVARFRDRADDLFFRESATETVSLFSIDQLIIFGPLTQLGISFYLAIVPLGLATWYALRRYEPGWLAVVTFAWFYFVLATIQVRFAAQFALFSALFGGMGLVYFLGAVELARNPTLFDRTKTPEGRPLELPQTPTIAGYLVAVLSLVLLFNLIFVPTMLGQTQYSDDQFDAAMSIEQHAAATENHTEEFVLNEWGQNRMYNYFVSGESRSYGYAQSNHLDFISDTDPDEWADEFSGQVGYVVLNERDTADGSVYTQLFEEFGAGEQASAHYQLLFSTEEVRAFAFVEAAQIETTAEPNETVIATKEVDAAGEQFTYERSGVANEDGEVSIHVAYPGEYDLDGETVTVTEAAVYDGATVST